MWSHTRGHFNRITRLEDPRKQRPRRGRDLRLVDVIAALRPTVQASRTFRKSDTEVTLQECPREAEKDRLHLTSSHNKHRAAHDARK